MQRQRLAALALALATAATAAPRPGFACSCAWAGSFLTVAPRAPLVVRARVLSYHGERAGLPLAMDLAVVAVLRGELKEERIRVWGDNGMLCRPPVTTFPIGSEWLLALDGPGSKPGMTPDHSISACGRYWLELRDTATVRGNIADDVDMDAVEEMALGELVSRLEAALSSHH